jgi:hypothetical protein
VRVRRIVIVGVLALGIAVVATRAVVVLTRGREARLFRARSTRPARGRRRREKR